MTITVARRDATELLAFVNSVATTPSQTLGFLTHGSGYRFVLLKLQGVDVVDATSGELDQKVANRIAKLADAGRVIGKVSKDKDDLPSDTDILTDFCSQFALAPNNPNIQSSDVTGFFTAWSELVGLKRKAFPQDVKNAVFARAGGCCEFAKCGVSLFEAEGHLGYFGYLAHIIGAVKNGPRGDNPLPAAQRNNPDNVLLLCDIHHRLIDRIAPDKYDIATLQNMRDASYRDRHAYSVFRTLPEVRVMALLTDIMGVTTDIVRQEIFEALRVRGLRPDTSEITSRYFGDNNGGRDANAPTYWPHFLESNRTAINALVHGVRGGAEFGPSGRGLAIFPLGNMPMVLLAGRIIGEARPVHLFHRDRTRRTWSDRTDILPPNLTRVICEPEITSRTTEAVVLALEITATANFDRLPDNLKPLPRVRVTCDRPGQDAFSEADMAIFFSALKQAVQFVQDELKATTIHLVPIAPADCVFAMGMKIQARNHPRIVVYQARQDGEYFPALAFDHQSVSSATGQVTVPLL